MPESLTAYIVTFSTTSAALAAEKRAAVKGVAADLIPVPVAITSDCGFCLRIVAGLPDAQGKDGEQELRRIASLARTFGAEALWAERTWIPVASDSQTGSKRTNTNKEQKNYERIF
ncbi:MAG TPA: DUF3343 domain-containing protein [Spirochaetales bacterium]|nr:DUF3343 domain-containing protein [Spirochaetales bacterium]